MGAYDGECRITVIDDPVDGSYLRIIHADPRILIFRDVLESEPLWADGVSLTDGILRIEARNRMVVYRIGQYLPDLDAYEAEWPD